MARAFVALAAWLIAVPALAQPAAQRSLLVSASELASLANDPKVVVLHIPERPEAFSEGHIPGARFVRYGDLAVDGGGLGSELPPVDTIARVFGAAGVSDDSRVVVYAQSPVLAARAFFTLDVFGHRSVALLDGGWRAWRDAGLPVETGSGRQLTAGRFTARLDAQRVVDAAFIQQQMTSKAISLVDVRPDAEFFGTDGGMGGMHAAGHINGARQLTWNSLVGSEGKFLPASELKQRLATAGASASRPVVAYCMVGMRASVVYFVARHLGYDARLYDGSIVDWTRRKLPVTTK